MSNNGRFGTITGLILGPLFAIVGYFVAFTFGKPILDNAKRSVDWPSVSGVVTQSALETSRSKGKTMYSFDVGYRYFHIDTIRQANVAPNQFAASELMFGLRFYEPFRNWRR